MSRRMFRELTSAEQEYLDQIKACMGMTTDPAWYFWTKDRARGMDVDCATEMRDAFGEVGFLDFDKIEAGALPEHREALVLGSADQMVTTRITANIPSQGGKENPRFGILAPERRQREYEGTWWVEQQRLLRTEEKHIVAVVADSDRCVVLNVTDRVNSDNTSLEVLERYFNRPQARPRKKRQTGGAGPSGRKGGGSGYTSDATKRDAIDDRAMEVVTKDLEAQGFEVLDVSSPPGLGHDLRVTTRSGKVLHVEVKGTRADPALEVHVTGTQIRTARSKPESSALAVVDGITIVERKGRCVGTGGNRPRYVRPWDPKDSEVTIRKATFRMPSDRCFEAEELDR